MSNFLPYQSISNKLALLNTYHKSILEEYKTNICELEFRDFTQEQKEYIEAYSQGYPIGYETYYKARMRDASKWGWHIAPLFAENNLYHTNTSKLPILTQVLTAIGMTTVCAINVLDPGQSLDWHIDKDYIPGVQLLRIMWGLDADSDGKTSIIQIKNEDGSVETKDFKNQEFCIFHPLSEHRVENNMSVPRSVVCIDYISDSKYRKGSIL
jgi:hypothetical protein